MRIGAAPVGAPGREAEFERRYGAARDWAQLFRRSPDYRGTLLLRDQADPLRYLTIDTWKDREAFESFKRRFEAEYKALDLECEALTESERCLGWFGSVEEALLVGKRR